jgi:hypothetical protein
MGPDKEKFFMERTLQELLQVRNNNGGDGIANNVEILTVRAVDGDEYDKDIALNSCS